MSPASALATNETLTMSPEQVASAQALDERTLAPAQVSRMRLQFMFEDGSTAELPDTLISVVQRTLRSIGDGNTLTTGSLPSALTTTAAADLLGISRTTLMKRIHRGEIPSHKAGTHTRLKASDVLAAQESARAGRREAVERLLDLEDELGMHN